MGRKVAPHAGAWIETTWNGLRNSQRKSHPMRVRGLKPVTGPNTSLAYTVAPHAGAWIETKQLYSKIERGEVAPHAGAWIETRAA